MEAVRRALAEAPWSMRQVADDAQIGYAAIRGWKIGRKAPLPDALRRLSAALRRKATRLVELADELDRTAQG